MVLMQINSTVELAVGMRIRFDGPMISSECPVDNFLFRTYRGRLATIVGFYTQRVGILDTSGRLPGLYYNPHDIQVTFDDDDNEVQCISLSDCTLVSETSTCSRNERLSHQRSGDLEHAYAFYPNDVVQLKDDISGENRIVREALLDNAGVPYYLISETAQAREERLAKDEREREERLAKNKQEKGRPTAHWNFILHRPSHEQREHCKADELALVAPGNTRWLYTDPDKMRFKSGRDEVTFWTHPGLSRSVSTRQFSFLEGKQLLKDGACDILVMEGRNLFFAEHSGRKIHECYAPHRDRVRSLMRKLTYGVSEILTLDESLMLAMRTNS